MNKKKKKELINSFQETHRAHKYENLSFTIILVQPEHAGNIGSIARIMDNFNFRNLVIFNPIESVGNILSYETQGFAMHGKDILLNAEIIEIKDQDDHLEEFERFIKDFDLVIATTAKGSRYTNIKRLAIFPEDLEIPISVQPLKIGILLGKESRGLTNDEIRHTDILIRIPTSDEYPTLNLSHACGIVLYEIFKKINVLNIGRGKNPILLADKEDRLMLLEIIKNIIESLKIRSYKKENVYFAFRNIFERSLMSKKELSLVMGLFSKVGSILEGLNLYEES